MKTNLDTSEQIVLDQCGPCLKGYHGNCQALPGNWPGLIKCNCFCHQSNEAERSKLKELGIIP